MNNGVIHASIVAEDAIPYSTESNLSFPPLKCHIQPSELICLVGPHRSQLRAYLLMLAGISKPVQGNIEILGQVVSELDQQAWQKLRCQIGYLSGASPLLSVQPALMNVMLPLLYHVNLPFREAADKARALLAELGCHFELTTYPALLNSFQRLQLALARALILDPRILILDVPFNNLGASDRQKMGVLLNKYKKNRAVCMMGGLQYPLFLEQYADRIVFISEHKIITFSSWESFIGIEDPAVRELLGLL